MAKDEGWGDWDSFWRLGGGESDIGRMKFEVENLQFAGGDRVRRLLSSTITWLLHNEAILILLIRRCDFGR